MVCPSGAPRATAFGADCAAGTGAMLYQDRPAEDRARALGEHAAARLVPVRASWLDWDGPTGSLPRWSANGPGGSTMKAMGRLLLAAGLGIAVAAATTAAAQDAGMRRWTQGKGFGSGDRRTRSARCTR
jgi:hypothetical protein